MIDFPKPEKEALEDADPEFDDGFETEVLGKATAAAVMQRLF